MSYANPTVSSVQVAARLARNLGDGDFTKVCMTCVDDLMSAMNAGLHEMFTRLPTRFRETTASATVFGPKTVTVGVTADSNILASGAFDAADIGKTVLIPGDAHYNEVNGTNTLLDGYLGATAAALPATVYCDSILDSSLPFDRLAGHPMVNRGGHWWPLDPFNPKMHRRNPAVGTPRWYFVETLAYNLGGRPRWVLRIAPMPDTAYIIRFILDFWSVPLTAVNLQQAVDINIPPEMADSIFIPICLAHLIRSPAWNEKTMTKKDALEGAKRAYALIDRTPGQSEIPANFCGTPRGW